ncbi:hypothetical protein R0J91_14285, partial [Micrococcus sp. SIMBA_131]
LSRIDPIDFFGEKGLERVREYFLTVHKTRQAVSFNTSIVTFDKEVSELNVTFVPIYLNEKLDRIYAMTKDITRQQNAEKQTHQRAYDDALTSLPNLRSCVEHVE